MPDTRHVLTPIKSLRQLLGAAVQVKRLISDNPAVTAFMISRGAGGVAGTGPGLANWVSLGSVSPFLICGLIGAEDPVFFHHHGVWWNQVKIAVLQALILRQPVRAVSTITQQLARNLFLAPDRSIARKLREAVLARRLEAILTKRRILELYLNVAEWGDGLWGIGAAAKEYCGCAPGDLDAFQSIVLVSLLPAPRVPVSGRNAQRAFATQRRLPRFLYSAGMLSLTEEKEALMHVTHLEYAVRQGMPLANALRHLVPLPRHSAVERTAKPTVEALLADHCGWTRRLRFEDFLRQVSMNHSSLDARPMWWTDAAMIEEPSDAANG